jgi:2-dehydro-3-deoxygluconokinase
MRPITIKSARAIGEAMVEMAPEANGLYRRGFAGDTFNTAWHMAQWLGPAMPVGLITRIGSDVISDMFLTEMADDALVVAGVQRDPVRRMGLYLIQRDGVERSFHYWRETSAARHLADDPAGLFAALAGVGLVHLSGITLAILPPQGRKNLFGVLAKLRAAGKLVVAFDPNIRPALWASAAEMQQTVTQMLGLTDIALPSLDDEMTHFGDRDAAGTIARMTAAGVGEIVVKNGAAAVVAFCDGETRLVASPVLDDVRDTTGAGDAFNAGYLAARLCDQDQHQAVQAGQRMAAAVLSHYGARAGHAAIAALPPLRSPA